MQKEVDAKKMYLTILMKRGRNNTVNKVTRKVRTNPPTMIKTIPKGCRLTATTRVSCWRCIDFPDLKNVNSTYSGT